jgi:hypothetical protein
LVQSHIDTFNKAGVDVILVSSDHIPKLNGVKNYITCKNVCDISYLSEGQSYIKIGEEVTFWRNSKTAQAKLYSSYFIKLYQIVTAYASNIGYDYMYFIDQDMVMSQSTINDAFSTNLDTSKVHLYTWDFRTDIEKSSEYQVTFFHGNLKSLKSYFTDEKLNSLAIESREKYIMCVENAFYFLAQNDSNISFYIKNPYDMFDKYNMFSSNNVADVYFDPNANSHTFLHHKGDLGLHSTFSAELYKENELIYSNTLRHAYNWSTINLLPNTKYTIKYYDNEICADTLSKTTELNTSMHCTDNYITQP